MTTTKQLLAEYNELAVEKNVAPLKAWKNSVAALQAKIERLRSAQDNDNTKPKAEKKKAQVKVKAMTAAEWARELNKNPKVARAKLRRAGIEFKDKALAVGSPGYKIIASINAE